ncbi:MAG: aminoacyl-tRNA hydrolase [Deltaproteobacteria bacterium]|nr:aminoacyl-tRNA hydrolase [Deltaproteobacteria bacterium]
MFVIAGLGNPGAEYEDTRHNVGFMLVDRAALEYGIKLKRSGKALSGRGSIKGVEVALLKPLTYMNLSGEAVRAFVESNAVSAESIMAAYDDCDLPLGRIRLRKNGGSGGHRGVESMVRCLGTNDFKRMRLGVGRREGVDTAEYVLSPFEPEEKAAVEEMLSKALAALEAVVAEGMDLAMNRFNSV